MALYVQNRLKVKPILLSYNIEQLWVSFVHKGEKYFIGVVYRLPHLNIKYLIDALEQSLSSGYVAK